MSHPSDVIEPATPHSRKKRNAILAAATEAFLEAGYGAATMDDIAGRAQVSKQTIYHHFGSKEVLFAAMIEERCEDFLAPIGHVEAVPGDLDAALRRLGVDFLEKALTPESLALHRLVLAQSLRFPELGRLSYESGAKRITARLAAFLGLHDGRDGLRFADPALAAEQFFGALLGFLQIRAILCDDAEANAARIDRHVEYAVAVFIKGHRRP